MQIHCDNSSLYMCTSVHVYLCTCVPLHMCTCDRLFFMYHTHVPTPCAYARRRYSAWTSQLAAKVAAAAKSLAAKLPAPTCAPAAAPAAGYKGMDYYSALGVLRRVLEEGRTKGLPPPVIVSEGANTMVSAFPVAFARKVVQAGGVAEVSKERWCRGIVTIDRAAQRAWPRPLSCQRAPAPW